jgi:hypothetical protein
MPDQKGRGKIPLSPSSPVSSCYNIQMDESENSNLKKELDTELLWEGYEYDFFEKTGEWYWMLGTIAVLLIVLAILVGNYLLALIIVLGAFILGTHARREPRVITFGLTKNGIKHGETVFRYDTVRSFWVDESTRNLIIESGRMVKPHIYIPLNDTDPNTVRQLLLPLIKEVEFHGSFADLVSEFFGI